MKRTQSGRDARPIFTMRVFKDEDGYYVAYCEEIPGCATQGKSLKEAQSNFMEALSGCLTALAEMTPSSKGRVREGAPVRIRKLTLTPLPA